MIDIHSHILPELDDGADSLQTSIMMAAMAGDSGCRAIIATPHVIWDGCDLTEALAAIRRKTAELQQALTESRIPVTCCYGAEVLCVDTTARLPDRTTFPCLNDTCYTLVEFSFDAAANEIRDHLERLLAVGLWPIIAHPERYRVVQKKKVLLEDWRRMDCRIQCNIGSLRGDFGRRAERTSAWAMEHRLVDFLATDAHDIHGRTPLCGALLETLAEHYGPDRLCMLTEGNPLAVLRGERLP